jgi:hypothetical protein
MSSFTSDLSTSQIVDRLHDLAPSMVDIAPLREATEPVVERINETLGRSSSRPSWRWIIVGALGVAGVVALVSIVKRRRAEPEVSTEDQAVRLAS